MQLRVLRGYPLFTLGPGYRKIRFSTSKKSAANILDPQNEIHP